MHRPDRRAFTLIELLVVISIIALLIGILLPALGAARATSKQLQCLSQLRQLGTLSATYQTDHDGYFPSAPFDPNLAPSYFTAWFRPFHRLVKAYRPPLATFQCSEVTTPNFVRIYYPGFDGYDFREEYSLDWGDAQPMSYGSNQHATFYDVADPWLDARVNNRADEWKKQSDTGLFADSSGIIFENFDSAARRMLRVANANSPHFFAENWSSNIEPLHKRHIGGTNMQYMDGHGETLSQEDAYNVRVNPLDP